MRLRNGWALAVVLLLSAGGRAESFQPASHVTRGIYVDLRDMMRASIWKMAQGACTLTGQDVHAGEACLRVAGAPDKAYGASQHVVLNQREPRPVKIAGWSRAEGVSVGRPYRYSIYVDFKFTDGKPWYMKVAPFAPGTHGWEYAETVVRPPKPLASAEVHVFLREAEGTAWFDDLFLGEADGPNLLACPGFERETQRDQSQREKLFADLAGLHCNGVHGYLPSTSEMWDAPLGPDNELLGLLRDAGARGIGIWLTLGASRAPVRDARDPNFPQYDCVNGPWGAAWEAALAKAARYPLAGISVVPDEYNWNSSRLKEAFAKHADPAVREFYARLGAYCDCPECRRRFAERQAGPFPQSLPSILPSADATYRQWLAFRYQSTTDWIRRCCQAVKGANPAVRTDSLLCVSPICSDMWCGPGVAWDRLGDEAGLEYPTTDPYILLHNYRGDSTHWYVTETAEHLAACGPQRRSGIVLQGSRLRREHRELDPVEIYGPALSTVWHGAGELAWFHHRCITEPNSLAPNPAMNRAAIAGVYGLLEKIDPWLEGLAPEPGVALLFSRASCDAWRLYVQAAGTPLPFDNGGVTEPRWAAQVQKEALYLLLRSGTPTTVYYLETVRKEQLSRHPVVLVPFALAIDPARASFLEELAREGKRVVVCGPNGPLDALGNPLPEPALAGLLPEITAGQEVAERPLGRGAVLHVARGVLERQAAHRENEKRTFQERVLPGVIDPATARTMRRALGPAPAIAPLLAGRLPEGDDLELALATNRRGERLLLAINWDASPRSVRLRDDPLFEKAPAEAYMLGPDGRWVPWKGRLGKLLELAGQQALAARW